MTSKTTRQAGPKASTTAVPLITITASGRQALMLYEQEIATYLRELPRLLTEGHTGRHALVKGDEVVGVWDKQEDAIQAARERFGIEPIFVKTVDPRDPEPLRPPEDSERLPMPVLKGNLHNTGALVEVLLSWSVRLPEVEWGR